MPYCIWEKAANRALQLTPSLFNSHLIVIYKTLHTDLTNQAHLLLFERTRFFNTRIL